jgi:uncharacterized protein YgiM (DUF1202 family)
MTRYVRIVAAGLLLTAISLVASACKDKGKPVPVAQLPDLNEQMRPYVTTENTKVRAGPGTQFRAIAEVGRDAKVNVVGRDGDWVLIVSKKGNAPGYIEMASVKAWEGSTKEALNPSAEGKYETVTDTQVRSGPGLHYPVVANIAKGTKLNVVEEERGWLKVESKRGNKPGYVEASLAKPATE